METPSSIGRRNPKRPSWGFPRDTQSEWNFWETGDNIQKPLKEGFLKK